jgi:hypothetical protein
MATTTLTQPTQELVSRKSAGSIKSRRIPCSDRSGIKAVWKLNKTNGDVKPASVHNSYTEFYKRLKTKDGSPAWIRTTIHGSKGRCPTIRRPGNGG